MKKNNFNHSQLPTPNSQLKNGFTLIELLIVIGIISILASIVFVAIDPVKRMGQARNTRRWSEATSVVNAVLKYSVDHAGNYPGGLDTDLRQMGTDSTGCDSPFCLTSGDLDSSTACLDLSAYLADDYLSAMPQDPKTGTEGKTRYAIRRTSAGRINVIACDAEQEQAISASR